MRQKVKGYSKGSKFFHWLVATIVIAMLSVSFFLGDLPEQYQPSAYMIHKSFGLTVLFLVFVLFFWVQYTGKPALAKSVPLWQKILAHIVQYSLYVLLIFMPV